MEYFTDREGFTLVDLAKVECRQQQWNYGNNLLIEKLLWRINPHYLDGTIYFIIFYVSSYFGDEYGQFTTKEKAYNRIKELRKLKIKGANKYAKSIR